MTPEERQMLTDLANKVAQTPVPPLDKEAEELIRTRIGSRPDALYLMTQTVLIQNMALEQAKQQIQQLQQAPQTPAASSSSFLGNQAPGRPSGYGSAQQGYSAPQPPPPTYQTVPVAGSGATSGGGSSFLKGAAQTAAGVAAGALAFEGIRSLFSGVEHMGGGGGFFGGSGIGGYGAPPEETVINNYYDSSPQDDRGDRDQYDDNTQSNDASQDYEDTSDDSSDYSDDDGSGGDFLA
jgi:hypothetical protein